MTASLDLDAPEPWALLAAKLRERDHDAAYADAPVWDIYARLSYNPTTGELEKTDRQIGDGLTALLGKRVRLGAIHRDDNKSAWKRRAKRPGWDALMDRIQSKKTQGVQAWHTDRLMRQPRDLEQLIDLGNAGFGVASCFGEYDLANHDHRFQLRILTAAACKASDDTSERQRRKMQARRDRQQAGGGPRAFGFPGQDRQTRQPVPESQVLAEREAIEWGTLAYLDGTQFSEIAAEWNRRGLRTVKGAEHTLKTVRAILYRARNAGLIEHDSVIVGRAVDVVPIVSEANFRRVRSTMLSRKAGRPPKTQNLGSGHLKCERCGKNLHARPEYWKKGEIKTYADGTPRRQYKCSKTSGGCGSVSIDQRSADATLKTWTLDRLSDPNHIDMMVVLNDQAAKLDERIAKAKRTLKEIGRRLADPNDETMDLDLYDDIKGPLLEGLAELKAERAALESEGLVGEMQVRTRKELEEEWDDESTPGFHDRRRTRVSQAFPLGLTVSPGRTGSRFDPRRIKPIDPKR